MYDCFTLYNVQKVIETIYISLKYSLDNTFFVSMCYITLWKVNIFGFCREVTLAGVKSMIYASMAGGGVG
jgi:hypothetical protein